MFSVFPFILLLFLSFRNSSKLPLPLFTFENTFAEYNYVHLRDCFEKVIIMLVFYIVFKNIYVCWSIEEVAQDREVWEEKNESYS